MKQVQIERLFSYLDTRHVFGEALILFADLERQLSGMTHHQHRYLGDSNYWSNPNSFY